MFTSDSLYARHLTLAALLEIENMYRVSIESHINVQVILAFWLALVYDLLEDRRTIEVLNSKFLLLCFKMAEILRIKIIFHVTGQR